MEWKAEQEAKEKQKERAAKRIAAASPQPTANAAEQKQETKKPARPLRPVDARQALQSGDLPDPDPLLPVPNNTVPQKEDAANASSRLPPPPRPPSDLSLWQERDFLMARIRQQPDLLEAVERLGTDGNKEEQTVRILTRLLQPEEYAGLRDVVLGADGQAATGATNRFRFGSSRRTRGEESYAKQAIGAAVDALGKNRTPAAHRSLAQLITGDLATEDNLAAATAALESLADYPTRVHEDMLFRIAVEAERLVTTEEPPIPPDLLGRQALALLEREEFSEARVRMAEYLVQNDPPLPVRRGLERILSDLTHENLEAHRTLFMGPGDPTPPREAIARQFAAYSTAALSYFLRLDGHYDPDQADWQHKVARLLWTNNFALVVEGHLNRLDSWDDKPALLSLALSLPCDTMRAAVAEKINRQWEQGPNSTASDLIAEDLLVEPGILAVMRASLERRRGPDRLPSLVSLRRQRTPRSRTRRTDPDALRRQKQQEIRNAWEELAGNVAREWCVRCRDAAHDRDAAERARGRTIDWTAGIANLVVQPHTTEGITARHSVEWTNSSSSPAPGDLDPLRIDYVRIEERARPSRLLAHYERLLPNHHQRDLEDGASFEGILDDNEPGLLRSVDVRITRTAPQFRRLPEQEQDLAVEILFIEISRPVADRAAPAQ